MKTILIVDNEPSIRHLLRLMLGRARYHVIEVRDGAEALEWMQRSAEPAVVLLSTMMPTPAIVAVLHAAAEADFAQPHTCVLLTATPESLPPPLRPLLARLCVPVVGPPFAPDAVLAAITRAEQRERAPTSATRTVEPGM